MPIYEASRKPRRERWPLEFDLIGVPRDNAERQKLLQQRQQEEALQEENMPQVRNEFSVDKPSTEPVITDINNPPHKNYNPHDPKNQFPKMLYHHQTGRVLTVADAKQEQAAAKRGFRLKPSPDYDYSKVNRAGIAAVATVGEKREEEMSAEELAALDEAEESSAAAEQGGEIGSGRRRR